jgi:outer membrane immunogenic protein
MKIRNLSIVFLTIVMSVFTVNGQSPIGNGKKQLNAGIGFSGWGVPLYFGMDFGVQNEISLGFETSIRADRQEYAGTVYNSAILGISGNGNYHFNKVLEIPSEWDFYAGLNLGYYFWSVPSDYPGTNSSGIGIGAQVGGRYFFKKNFALNFEIGGGNEFSGGKFGITYILK